MPHSALPVKEKERKLNQFLGVLSVTSFMSADLLVPCFCCVLILCCLGFEILLKSYWGMRLMLKIKICNWQVKKGCNDTSSSFFLFSVLTQWAWKISSCILARNLSMTCNWESSLLHATTACSHGVSGFSLPDDNIDLSLNININQFCLILKSVGTGYANPLYPFWYILVHFIQLVYNMSFKTNICNMK